MTSTKVFNLDKKGRSTLHGQSAEIPEVGNLPGSTTEGKGLK
jgi:hypothetical protein